MVKPQINLTNMKKLIDYLKVGDKVFDIFEGWGTVMSLTDDTFKDTPLLVRFDGDRNFLDSKSLLSYTIDGKEHPTDINPSLFLHEIKLEQELPEFVEGEIVFANYGYQDSDWFVAKFVAKIGEYVVCPILNNCIDKHVTVSYVKSFDKSHFE